MVMSARTVFLTVVFILAVSPSCAQDTAKEHVIDLKDGGRLVLRADGAMGHYDAAGRPVNMKVGAVMIAKDGTRVLMKSDSLWRQIIDHAATSYALSSTLPWRKDARNESVVDLVDGGRITVRGDGTMAHYDPAGNAVRMKDGEVMIAKDGTRILMNNGTLWSPSVNRDAPRSEQ